MKHYNDYMDRQTVSDDLHDRLMNLERPKKKSARWPQMAALAACCALIVGVGMTALTGPAATTPPDFGGGTPQPGGIPMPDKIERLKGFLADSGEDKMMFPAIPYVAYPDLTGKEMPRQALDVGLTEGSFTVALTEEQICTILWGGAERMSEAHPKEKPGNVPWMLFWDGYTVSGNAIYSGTGDLMWLNLWGEREEDYFNVQLAPGTLPPTDIVREGGKVTDVRGVEITAWKGMIKGDGWTETHYESVFLAHNVGVRATFATRETDSFISDLFVNWCTYRDGGLSLEHLLRNGNIPAWRSEKFATLAEAREEPEFAPYLPKTDFSGYAEFYGRLTYQEGNEHTMFVRWSRGLDDVEIVVELPEGDTKWGNIVDADDPARYDLSLYPIPWCDSVPREYWETVTNPVFRAEDMTEAIVAARSYTLDDAGDTGSLRVEFEVLHPDGAKVSYCCKGLTVEQVWGVVRETL